MDRGGWSSFAVALRYVRSCVVLFVFSLGQVGRRSNGAATVRMLICARDGRGYFVLLFAGWEVGTGRTEQLVRRCVRARMPCSFFFLFQSMCGCLMLCGADRVSDWYSCQSVRGHRTRLPAQLAIGGRIRGGYRVYFRQQMSRRFPAFIVGGSFVVTAVT